MAASADKNSRRFRFSIGNRSLSFTPFGTRTVVVCLLVGAAAVNSGHNLLYLSTAMVLSMIIVSGILSEQTLKKITVTRSQPDELYAGTPFRVRYELTNEKRRVPSYSLAVSGLYETGRVTAEAFAFSVPARDTTTAVTDETAPSRGLLRLKGYELKTRFPFGMFEKSRRIVAPKELVVFPRPKRLNRDLMLELAGGLGEEPSARIGEGSELRSLRRYGPADDARMIHWKSSARTGVLMAKEMEAERDRAVSVILDNSPSDPHAFEEAVSLAASAVRTLLLEHGLPVRLVTRSGAGEPGVGRAHYLRLMYRLALVHASEDAPVVKDLAGLMQENPAVLVLPGPGSGWAGYRAVAGLTLEAGHEA